MNSLDGAGQEKLWSRPLLERTRPYRKKGRFFRAAEERKGSREEVSSAAEEAVVAAARLGYRIGEVQTQRSVRLAQRLCDGIYRRAAALGERIAGDNTERLVKQVVETQVRLAESILGFNRREKPKPSDSDMPEAAAKGERVTVVLEGACQRPVRVLRFEVGEQPVDRQIEFYSAKNIGSDPLVAHLAIDASNRSTLTIEVQRLAPKGRWKAAICDEEKTQIGMVEIEL